MQHDPLRGFRRQPASIYSNDQGIAPQYPPAQQPYRTATQPPAYQPGELVPYEAFKAMDAPRNRLHIRTVLKPWLLIKYSFLPVLECDEAGTWFNLDYLSVTVKVQGRLLHPVIQAIADDQCVFIRDWHGREHQPPEQGKPFISVIDYVKKVPEAEESGE